VTVHETVRWVMEESGCDVLDCLAFPHLSPSRPFLDTMCDALELADITSFPDSSGRIGGILLPKLIIADACRWGGSHRG
jgi:hypothetical protein